MTDEGPVDPKAVGGFTHGTVNHSKEEYVRAFWWHTNTVEGYFSILKRAMAKLAPLGLFVVSLESA